MKLPALSKKMATEPKTSKKARTGVGEAAKKRRKTTIERRIKMAGKRMEKAIHDMIMMKGPSRKLVAKTHWERTAWAEVEAVFMSHYRQVDISALCAACFDQLDIENKS
jgi:Holliday junction resolvasome RuvABC endonuclease subunit